eukprot:1878258-Rhodomonas_salina.8
MEIPDNEGQTQPYLWLELVDCQRRFRSSLETCHRLVLWPGPDCGRQVLGLCGSCAVAIYLQACITLQRKAASTSPKSEPKSQE